MTWLKQELEYSKRHVKGSHSYAKEELIKQLSRLDRDPDFAAVRDPKALAAFSEAERAAWQALWSDVQATLKKASAATTAK